VLALPRAAAGQTADPKTAFLQNLGRFSVALDGRLGDEGRDARAALDGMARGLDAWDATMRASEAAFATQLPGSSAADAARMHVAIGAAFLDRSRLQDALREFQAGSRLDPGRSDVLMFQGLAYDQVAGDADKAAASFRQAAALDPANPVLAYLLGRALGKAGKSAGSLQAFQTVLQLWSKDAGAPAHVAFGAPFIRLGLVQEQSGVEPYFPPVLYAEGFALLQRGEFANAIDAFRRAAEQDPLVRGAVDFTDPVSVAASAFRNSDDEAAARYIRVGIERDPNRADAHRLLGHVLLADRIDDEGLKELRLAVALDPGDERARLALSDALVQLRRYPEAEAAYRDALKALPASGRAHYGLGRLYQRQNKTLDALAEFEAAAGMNPLIGTNRLLQTIGALNAARQDFDAALHAYSKRVDIHPNDADAHRSLGFTYVRLDRRDEAFAEFAVALWLAPGSPDVHVAMSQLYLKTGDYAAAADAARRAIALNPSHKQARYSLGTALMRLDRPGDAKPEFDAFERLQAEDTAAAARQMTVNGLRREAAASVESRDYQRAATALQKAIELLPNAFDVHEQLAAAYAALGRRQDSDREQATAQQLRDEALAREAGR
jgi:tetratricopeptide (TPR) repeat protein